VVTSYPMRAILRNPNMTDNIAKWAAELAEFELDFVPRHAVKSQVLADKTGVRAPRDGGGAAVVRTAIMAPSVGASSCATSGTASGATSGSPSDSTTSLGTPSGVRGSLIRAGPGATLTTTSATALPVATVAPEGEDLGKKGDKRIKPQKKEKRGRES
jgi:hypothetical protein